MIIQLIYLQMKIFKIRLKILIIKLFQVLIIFQDQIYFIVMFIHIHIHGHFMII
jgi:hypothetical protein